jgi:DNA repair protein RadC
MTISKKFTVPLFTLEAVREKDYEVRDLHSKDSQVHLLHQLLDRSPIEQMVVLYLNHNDELIGAEKVAMGNTSRVQAQAQEIFRGAIVARATNLIISHNHPYGGPTPSDPDLQFTSIMIDIGSLLGIGIKDHIIVSPDGTHFSIWDNRDKVMPRIDDLVAKATLEAMLSDSILAKFGKLIILGK